jgi:hypothetical protein
MAVEDSNLHSSSTRKGVIDAGAMMAVTSESVRRAPEAEALLVTLVAEYSLRVYRAVLEQHVGDSV